MSTKLRDYDYHLPNELIAQQPLPRREDSRMMVLDRRSESIQHRHFHDLKDFVRAGDLLVLNNTRVLAARRFSDDGEHEFLFLEKVSPKRWKCLAKPGRKLQLGATSKIDNVSLRVDAILPGGERILSLFEELDPYAGGSMPLPPYIKRTSNSEDDVRYQTVFGSVSGAVAAPTAGLHFTQAMLDELPHAFVTLHVGPGTFRPVRSEDISQHRMDSERFSISPEAAEQITAAKRVIAIGTTSVRVLEAARRENGRLIEQTGATDIFIHPPYRFQSVDAMLTNFHLPKSTLLMLVSAFAGREFILRAYQGAVQAGYRFYSYGDCMLIV